MANDNFSVQALQLVRPLAAHFSHTDSDATYYLHFAGELDNDSIGPKSERGKHFDLTGYNLMHGSKASVGGVTAVVTFHRPYFMGSRVDYHIDWVWNDTINPNPSYGWDKVLSGIMAVIASPTDYQYQIRWSSDGYFMQGSGSLLSEVGGWPLVGALK